MLFFCATAMPVKRFWERPLRNLLLGQAGMLHRKLLVLSEGISSYLTGSNGKSASRREMDRMNVTVEPNLPSCISISLLRNS